jgi:hypothetical protein
LGDVMAKPQERVTQACTIESWVVTVSQVMDEGSVEADTTRDCSEGYIAAHQLNGS